jgi:hypothetical protein
MGCGDGKESPKESAKETESTKGSKDAADKERQADDNKHNIDKAAAKVERKIVYIGYLDLVVEEFGKAVEQLETEVKKVDGYVAKSEERGSPRTRRTGHWTIRVPAADFNKLRAALASLGEWTRNAVESEDITDKYYDLKARLKTSETEEEGLRELYKQKAPTSKLEEIVYVRRELYQIRALIETQKGTLERWNKETELATLNVSLLDRKDYVPPTSPAFGTSIGRTIGSSFDALVSFFKGVVLFVVAVVPWLVLLVVPAVPLWRRWRRRQMHRSSTPPPPVELVSK